MVAPPTAFIAWYTLAATDQQKLCLSDAASQMPKIFDGAGIQRYLCTDLFSIMYKRVITLAF